MLYSWSMGLRVACGLSLAVTLILPRAHAIEPENVLVLYNGASADGLSIANHYQQVHPGAQLLELTGLSTSEDITANDYLNILRPQVLPALSSIDVIVTTKGLPLRIEIPDANPDPGNIFTWERFSSLESELTRIDTIDNWVDMGDQMYWWPPELGPHHATNPYFAESSAFDNQAYGIRLSTRLDGFTTQDVIDSIDRAQKAFIGPSFYSNVLLDDDPNAPASPIDPMEALVANVLIPEGVPHTYDGTDALITTAPGPVVGYVSHGRHGGLPPGYILDPINGLNNELGNGIDLANGALFHTWESFNAYSFEPGGNQGGQGLIAEWLSIGGTAGVGHVEEPGASLDGVTNEDVMYQMLLDGRTWAEAAWSATTQLSFVNTVVGDPLMVFRTLIPGDGSLNGFVDGADYVIYANGAMAGLPNPKFTDGDYNGDGTVGPADYVVWANNIVASAGDINGDGFTDAADYTIWANNFGLFDGDAIKSDGDLTADGYVNQADYTVWANASSVVPSGSEGGASGPAAIPEPSAAVLMALGLLLLTATRRRSALLT